MLRFSEAALSPSRASAHIVHGWALDSVNRQELIRPHTRDAAFSTYEHDLKKPSATSWWEPSLSAKRSVFKLLGQDQILPRNTQRCDKDFTSPRS